MQKSFARGNPLVGERCSKINQNYCCAILKTLPTFSMGSLVGSLIIRLVTLKKSWRGNINEE